MVEAAPAAALVVPEPDFLLEILVVPLDPPAQLGQVDHLLEADLLRQGRQPVLRRLRLALGPAAPCPAATPSCSTEQPPRRTDRARSRPFGSPCPSRRPHPSRRPRAADRPAPPP